MTVVTSHVQKAILNAPIRPEPWPHLFVENIFPPDFYEELLSYFPYREQLAPLSRKTTNRFVYWLERDGVLTPGVHPWWASFRAQLFMPLWLTLESKFKVRGRYTGSELLYDISGYGLGPHTDTPDKLITGLFYLPEVHADSGAKGTVLYKGEAPDPLGKLRATGLPPYLPREHSVIPYWPNSALFFVRTDMSYHGVHRTAVPRRLLAFDVFR